MGVAEQGNAVGVQLNHLRNGFFKRFGVLIGQAVDDVEIDGIDPACAQAVHNIPRDLEALLTANRLLDLFIKVLHTDAGAVHAVAGQGVYFVVVYGGRIDFDRKFPIGVNRGQFAQPFHQRINVLWMQNSGRTAAPVKTRYCHTLRNGPRELCNFDFQDVQICLNWRHGFHALGPTGAEPAKPFTERNVDVN